MKPALSVGQIADGIAKADRASLVRAITLIESHRSEDRVLKDQLLAQLPKRDRHSLRLGITGAPGVGKSTLIEKLGLQFLSRGLKLAVLSVDPSSQVHQGSILGDKSRMIELSRNPDAFVRPSPSGASLGGVNLYTREAILVCEAFGFDVVIVETVGIGQAEIAVFDIADISLLLIQPGAGDELQAIKKGVMEWADYFVITKADGKTEPLANKSLQELLHVRPAAHEDGSGPRQNVFKISAENGTGVVELLEELLRQWESMLRSDKLVHDRGSRNKRYFLREWPFVLREKLSSDKLIQSKIDEIGIQISEAGLTPEDGFSLLINFIFARAKDNG